MIDWVDYLVMTVVLTWTLVILLHMGKLGRAFQDDDWPRFKALNRQTMWMIAVWQITLGAAMGVWNIANDGGTWTSVMTLVGSGLGILVLDRFARRFQLGVYER